MQVDSTGRRKYSAPKLKTYGDMATFTAAGTGSANEASPFMNPNKIKP